MRYLTRIIVPKTSLTSLEIFDSYSWHQKLCKAYKQSEDDPSRFLFRVDDYESDVHALVLSKNKPELQSWGHWSLKGISSDFLQHDRYTFNLRANPTKRRRDDKTTSRKKFGIYNEEDLRKWLQGKSAKSGFEIETESLSISRPMDMFFTRKGQKGKHISVDFSGQLVVTDRSKFIETFNHGIGSAKSFGYGLITLIPLFNNNL